MTLSQSTHGLGAPASPRLRNRNPVAFWLLLPGLVAFGISFIAPLTWVARMSLNRGGGAGAIIDAFSPDTYIKVFTNPYTWELTLNSLKLGTIVTLITVIMAYPVALFLARTHSRFRGLLLALAVAPLLTSQVVRTYGWMVLLGHDGVVNSTLTDFELITTPLRLSNNYTGVVIALVEILMPYAILIMVSGFGKVTQDHEHAAASLGANRARVFWRVILPLSLPGVFTGALLVFVLTISSFVTPSLLGGGRVFLLATEIYSQAKVTLNWPQAAALSMLLFALFSVLIGFYMRAVKRFEQ